MRRGTQKERHDFRRVFLFGGPEETRTLDLSDANRTLSQLSYRPILPPDPQRQMLLYHKFQWGQADFSKVRIFQLIN